MIVAITGGTGFIGRRLVLRHLANGDDVRVLSRRLPCESGLPDSVEQWTGDLAKQASLLPFVEDVDVIYHCAGEIRDTACMQAVHVEGTRKLIAAAAGKVGRWVQLSSVGAYGKHREGTVTEETALNPGGVYEVTKAKSDALVEAAGRGGAFSYVILRPSNVYAEEMTNRSLFSLIAMVQRGWFFFIGKPGAQANYIHVDNVVEALLLCGTSPQAGGVYNLSDQCSMEEFIAAIAGALGKDVPLMRLPETPVRLLARWAEKLPGVPLSEARVDALTSGVIYSTTKIERELGYRHIFSIKEGVAWLTRLWLREAEKTKK